MALDKAQKCVKFNVQVNRERASVGVSEVLDGQQQRRPRAGAESVAQPCGWTMVLLLIWWMNGGMVAREALFGATVALARQKVRSHLRVSFTNTMLIISQ